MPSASPEEPTQIYLLMGEEQSGPFTFDQIRGLWHQAAFTSDAHYWHEGLENWGRLEDLMVSEPGARQHPSGRGASGGAAAAAQASVVKNLEEPDRRFVLVQPEEHERTVPHSPSQPSEQRDRAAYTDGTTYYVKYGFADLLILLGVVLLCGFTITVAVLSDPSTFAGDIKYYLTPDTKPMLIMAIVLIGFGVLAARFVHYAIRLKSITIGSPVVVRRGFRREWIIEPRDIVHVEDAPPMSYITTSQGSIRLLAFSEDDQEAICSALLRGLAGHATQATSHRKTIASLGWIGTPLGFSLYFAAKEWGWSGFLVGVAIILHVVGFAYAALKLKEQREASLGVLLLSFLMSLLVPLGGLVLAAFALSSPNNRSVAVPLILVSLFATIFLIAIAIFAEWSLMLRWTQ